MNADEASEHRDDRDREEALVDLLRLDYDATLRTMNGIVTTGGQIRAIGIAAWSVAIGLAVRGESLELSVLATALVVVFLYSDAYHAALYRRTLQRAIKLESMLDRWIDRLGIDADDPGAIIAARAKLEMHRFGVHRSLPRPDWKEFLKARPRPIFWLVYPALLAASLAAAIAYGCS